MNDSSARAINLPPLPIYILAGGRSRRFGSDKALASFDGKTMLERVAHAFSPIATRVTVVAERAGKYDPLGLSTIGDKRPTLGPLAGLETALKDRIEKHGEGLLALASCDQLNPSCEQIEYLFTKYERGVQAAIYFDDDYWQPMPGLYHTSILPIVTQRLDQGKRSMQELLQSIRCTPVAPPQHLPPVAQANTQAAMADYLEKTGDLR